MRVLTKQQRFVLEELREYEKTNFTGRGVGIGIHPYWDEGCEFLSDMVEAVGWEDDKADVIFRRARSVFRRLVDKGYVTSRRVRNVGYCPRTGPPKVVNAYRITDAGLEALETSPLLTAPHGEEG